MSSILRQSTARTILVGPVLDSAGEAKADEVVGSIKITKNGTVGAANGSATLTHNHAGKYLLALTISDTDTVGVLEISLNSGANDMPVARFNVVEEAVWDAYFAPGATMSVTLATGAITASVFDESTAYPLKAADTGSTAVARTGADGDTLEVLSDQIDTVATQASVNDLPTHSDLSAALAVADDAVLAAIAALNNLSSAGAQAAAAAALTAYQAAKTSDVPGAATVASAVRAELATELGRVDVATSTRLAASGYAAPDNASVGAIKAVTDKLDTTLVQDGAVYDFTGAALAAAPTSSGGGGASAVDIAGAVCDELLASHTIPGSLGEAVAAAGTAGNPWISDLSGYVAGQAGYELHALYDQVMDVLPDYPTISVPAPPTAEQSTAWIRCLDEHGTPEGGVTIQLRMAYAEGGADAYDSTVLSATSAPGTGLWSQTIPRGAGYLFDARRGTEGRWTRFRGANTPTVLLPSLLGTP